MRLEGASGLVSATSALAILSPGGSLASEGTCAAAAVVAAAAIVVAAANAFAVIAAAVAAATDTSGCPAAVALTDRGPPT